MKISSALWAKVLKGLLPLPFFLVAVSGCRRSDAVQSDPAGSVTLAPVAVATRAPLSNTLDEAGEFLPYQEVELHAKVAGYIRNIHVDIGDKVRAGEVLATLDVPELTAQVQGATAGVQQTKEQIGRAKSEILRAQADYAALHSASQRLQQASAARPGLIAQQELDDAMAKDRSAAAAVDASKATLAAMQQQLGVSQADQQRYSAMVDYSRIVAPFSGVVTWRYADTGALIQSGTSNASSMPVVKLAETDVLRLRLPVPASLVGYVHLGDTATIRVQSLGLTFPGKIARTTGALDPATRTMQVEIDVPNKNGKLEPGMYADVSLAIRSAGDALVVPIQAVDQSGTQPFVMLVNGADRVEKRTVELGITTATEAEILGGLKDGDKVIVAQLASFEPGETVKPQRSVSVGFSPNGEGK